MGTVPSVVVLKQQPYPFHAGTIGIARSLGHLACRCAWPANNPARLLRIPLRALDDGATAVPALARAARPVAPRCGAGGETHNPPPRGRPGRGLYPRAGAHPARVVSTSAIDKRAAGADSSTSSHLAALARSAGLEAPTHAVPSTSEQVDMFLAETPFPGHGEDSAHPPGPARSWCPQLGQGLRRDAVECASKLIGATYTGVTTVTRGMSLTDSPNAMLKI